MVLMLSPQPFSKTFTLLYKRAGGWRLNEGSKIFANSETYLDMRSLPAVQEERGTRPQGRRPGGALWASFRSPGLEVRRRGRWRVAPGLRLLSWKLRCQEGLTRWGPPPSHRPVITSSGSI